MNPFSQGYSLIESNPDGNATLLRLGDFLTYAVIKFGEGVDKLPTFGQIFTGEDAAIRAREAFNSRALFEGV
jgi:hypothetical protein